MTSRKNSKNTEDDLSAQDIRRLKYIAIRAALSAGGVLRKHFQKRLDVREKKGAGIVTNADIEAENTALAILCKAFPEFGVLAEESDPESVRTTRGRWIIDPLDGTTNFAHGFPMFCVSIAAEWDGEVIVGVIYHPILEDLYVAVRDQGATINGKPMKVARTKETLSALFTTGFAMQRGRELKRNLKVFESITEISRGIRRPGSAALDLAYTARGVFDAFWERGLSPWDVAAGALLVEEAGGKISDYHGEKATLMGREILASNPLLHAQLVKQLSANFKKAKV